jgi:hypothetical protein
MNAGEDRRTQSVLLHAARHPHLRQIGRSSERKDQAPLDDMTTVMLQVVQVGFTDRQAIWTLSCYSHGQVNRDGDGDNE